MTEKHMVVFCPGLDGKTAAMQLLTLWWPSVGLQPVMYPMVWKDEEGFEAKFKRLLHTIDGLIADGNVVSGIGFSAGGALIFNAFLERATVMYRVVSVNGRLYEGTNKGVRGFDRRTKLSRAFAESVRRFEKRLPMLPEDLMRRMMTTRAWLFDELVPPETTDIAGVKHYVIPWGEHVMSAGMAVSLLSFPIIRFLQDV